MKACRICARKKLLSDFHRASGMRDGHRSECKECTREIRRRYYANHRDESIARVERWRRENPKKFEAWKKRNREENRDRIRVSNRRGHLRRKYGISLEDFDFLVVAQAGRCALCDRHDGHGLHVDHDHTSGRVRGLLCGKCNKAIGLLDEDPRLFAAAVGYLTETQLTLGCGDREKPPRRPRRKVTP